jgi:hypothetical protein
LLVFLITLLLQSLVKIFCRRSRQYPGERGDTGVDLSQSFINGPSSNSSSASSDETIDKKSMFVTAAPQQAYAALPQEQSLADATFLR